VRLTPASDTPHVVIVGAGFGGLAAARALRRADVAVTVIDQRNYHLFQPLLYQVATAGLSPAEIAAPIRAILRDQANARVLLGRVATVDAAGKAVVLADGARVPFDWLIVATGAQHSYFGNERWARHAPGIKTIDDALAVRRRVLLALERAETETDPDRRRALLTFVVIGGGPTGVEMAGAIAELARKSVSRDFRSITPRCSRVILVEAGPRLLPSFPRELSEAALRSIETLGVEVRLGVPVTAIDADGVRIGQAFVGSKTVIWGAGVKASPAATWLDAEADRLGRVIVDETLRPADRDTIFVIGDTAACPGPEGRPLPGLAPVAKQQGAHVARQIVRAIRGKPVERFRYRDAGNLATIGRSRAVAEFGRVQISGFVAWLLWSVAHVYFLIGFRSRLAVSLNWVWHYLTFDRSARLITGEIDEALTVEPIEQAA
jgi:NADH dehydrogenase